VDKLERTIKFLAKQTSIPTPSRHLLTKGKEPPAVVTIKLNGSNKFLYHMEANKATLSFGHFGFKEMTVEEAKDDDCAHFAVETSKTMTQLRSIVYGELVSMTKHDTIPKGAVATAVEEASDATALQAIYKNGTLRLVGPHHQHLRLITVITASGQPYDVLASKSRIPDQHGLFTLTQI
jgi:hypothetical protein